jgi:hypothetical protein
MRVLIGTELRIELSVNKQYATRLAILRLAEGIGDDIRSGRIRRPRRREKTRNRLRTPITR